MSLDDIATHWSDLGEKDPMWAVLTDKGKDGGRWTPEEFLATGRAEIRELLSTLEQHGVTPTRNAALDFGCGAGRLTQGLVEEGFESALGVDISEPMLRTAASLNRHVDKCHFLHNVTPDLTGVPDNSVDLVYSCRVLQHMPPALAHGYIQEFFRVARAGGTVVFQIPVRPVDGVYGTLMRLAPTALLNRLRQGMEMHGSAENDICALVDKSGGQVVTILGDTAAGPRWVSQTYVCKVARGIDS